MAKGGQPRARTVLRVVDSSGRKVLPRKYAQSTSGLHSSQETSPSDSLSMLIARDSPQVLWPYATLFRCPNVVSHRRAKSSLATMDSDFQNSSSSMRECNHMVLEKAIPVGYLTKWLEPGENVAMDREQLNEVRRQNLREYVKLHCGGKKADMIKKLPKELGNEAYWRNMLSTTTKKSFSWQKARETEPHLGLLEGELEIPGSSLRMDPARLKSHKEELIAMIQRMQPDEHLQMLNHGAQIFRKRPLQSGSQSRSKRA